MSHMLNVVLTTAELGGVGFFTSNISKAWNYMHPGPYKLRWRYESSRFEATRERRPLPEGWIHCWNADPRILLERGFDKVIVLQKTLVDSYIGLALYFNALNTIDSLEEDHPRFFEIIKRKWEFMEQFRKYKHERFMYVHFDDLNNHTVKTFNEVFDFLEFEKEGRPMMIPVKVWRNWECYSNVEKSGNEWFEKYDPLYWLRKDFSRKAMLKDFFIKDLKFTNIKEVEEIINGFDVI